MMQTCRVICGLVALCVSASACKDADKQTAEPSPNKTAGDEVPQPIPAKTDPTSQPGTWYRFAASADDTHPVPFFAFIPDKGDYAAIKNADQVMVGRLVRENEKLAIRFPVPGTTLSASIAEGGAVSGTWTTTVLEKTTTLPISGARVAKADLSTRFAATDPSAPAPADIAGHWRLDMGELGEVKLSLEMKGRGITGEITFPSGNWIYLAGNATGSTIRLSSFDTTAFYFLRATRNGDGLSGEWIAGPDLATHAAFTGKRTDNFEVERTIGAVATHLSIPELSQSRYQGKPVVVELSGTWCANCLYANAVLVDLYEAHHKEGLEIITLLYEFTGDEAYNNRQAKKYAVGYDIPWQVVAVHGGVERASEIVPPGLEGLDTAGFPVAIFVNPDGTIHEIHAGFPSPEMTAYPTRVELYEKLVKAIVANQSS